MKLFLLVKTGKIARNLWSSRDPLNSFSSGESDIHFTGASKRGAPIKAHSAKAFRRQQKILKRKVNTVSHEYLLYFPPLLGNEVEDQKAAPRATQRSQGARPG